MFKLQCQQIIKFNVQCSKFKVKVPTRLLRLFNNLISAISRGKMGDFTV